ncbi:NAD(P)H-hydrate epimerase, partial [Candidatus Bipolaricaulota bacterium]|nr:NAD(P)H-hydrate epimerase [Candidatus Bipolaricaulota bacterium]
MSFDHEDRWVLQASDQAELDRRAEEEGIAQDALMESAGRSAADWLLEHLRPHRAVVLVGPGGNGGDALVVARRLHEAGVDAHTFLVAPSDALSTAAERMLNRLRGTGAGARDVSAGDLGELEDALLDADCVVDGLFGSGLTRALDGQYLAAVGRLNDSTVPTVSLDLPSGLASDRGALLGGAVCADITLAMAFLKPAHLLYPAAARCGNVAVVGVDYPRSALSDATPWARVCEQAGIRRRLPERQAAGHKGTFGRVLVVAGARGMTGAAMLCCRAAFRAGAGLVTLAAPASVNPILEGALPET